jgi:hypothetical protein
MTTATDKTAQDNGTGSSERRSGIDLVRDTMAWRTSSVMGSAAYEGNRLCDEISRAVQDAYFSRDDKVVFAADVALSDDVRAKADDASRLLMMAVSFLRELTRDPDEPPF